MNTTNSIKVVTRIVGAIEGLDEVCRQLTGGQIGRAARPEVIPSEWWYREIILTDQESTDAAISAALDALDGEREAAVRISDDPRFGVEMDCTITVDEEQPVMEVSVTTVKRLSEYSVSLAFDVYDYRE